MSCLDTHGFRSKVGEDVRCSCEGAVAGEDGDGVVPFSVGGWGATSQGRFVHVVIVVARGEVGEFDYGGGLDHVGVHRSRAEVGDQQIEQRAESLATGIEQVGRGVGGERVVPLQGLEHGGFNFDEAVFQACAEFGIEGDPL